MPTFGPYTVLNARVKQKLATEAYWLSIEDELGVIFEGEQAFVYDDDGQPINFKIGDGTKKFSELPYFIARYTDLANQKVLGYVGQTANLTIAGKFVSQSFITDLIFLNNSGGTIDLKIGTTDGGTEICEVAIPNDTVVLGLHKYFTSSQTVYFTGLTGKSYSLFLLYIQLNEAPAVIPSSSGGGVTYNYGTVYAFRPMYPGHENDVWDFGTGLGKAGGYENCVLYNDMDEQFLTGYKIGDTLGDVVGSNTATLIATNIPKFHIALPNSCVQGLSDNANDRNVMLPTSQQYINFGEDSPVPVSTKPKSRIILYFTGPATT